MQPSSSSKVHLIVAPEYGERLTALPPGEPAWVADTPSNKSVIQRMWSQEWKGITSFQVALLPHLRIGCCPSWTKSSCIMGSTPNRHRIPRLRLSAQGCLGDYARS